MNTRLFTKYTLLGMMFFGTFLTSCSNDDDAAPEEENELEVITDIKLIFTNTEDPTDVKTARAKDPDGFGLEELEILDTINLEVNKTYLLTFEIFNNLEQPGENIGNEINEEAAEHQIFYGFTADAFETPTENGNIGAENAADPVGYEDKDDNNLPLGLITTWKTSSTPLIEGEFRVVLQHQPEVKTATSTSETGENDFDLPFVLNIK